MAKKYHIEEYKLFQGVSNSIEKALSLANDAKCLLKKKDSFAHALGLYGFAIEEYGKAISLLESKKLKTCYKVSIGIFEGPTAHDRKFGRAIRDLPSICTDLQHFLTVRIRTNNPTTPQTFHGMDGESVSRGRDLTGKFEDKTDEGFFMSSKTRERCFYEDWDEWTNNWRPSLPIKINKLKMVIGNFQNHIRTNFY